MIEERRRDREAKRQWTNPLRRLALGFFACLLLCLAAAPATLLAQDTSAETAPPVKPNLIIPLPDLKFSDVVVSETEGPDGVVTRTIDVPFLAEYIVAVYSYMLAAGAIVAVVLMMIGGFEYLIGKPKEGMSRIRNAVTGLLLVFAAYIILETVNKGLVNFKGILVEHVARIEFNFEQSAEATFRTLADLGGDLSAGEYIRQAMDAGGAAGIDRCIVYATMKKESGGNPNAIGHDENYPHGNPGGKCPKIGARRVFLLSGLKHSGATFEPISSYACEDNANPNHNDDSFQPNSPPYYGLDWREGLSHGIGLSQQTLKPGKAHTSQCLPATEASAMAGYKSSGPCTSSRCTPNEWCKKVGDRWYTVGELLDPAANIESKITLLKKIIADSGSDVAQTFERYNGSKAYVPGAMEFYEACKADPAISGA